jgi:hypothetical protein
MEHLSYFQYGRGKLNEHLRRRNSFSRAVHGIEAVSSLRSVMARGRETMARVPRPGSLWSRISPWHRNTMAPEMARPRPAPPVRRVTTVFSRCRLDHKAGDWDVKCGNRGAGRDGIEPPVF